jgi:hypothetical protein
MKIKKNGKVINLTESDLKRIVKRVLTEQPEEYNESEGSADPDYDTAAAFAKSVEDWWGGSSDYTNSRKAEFSEYHEFFAKFEDWSNDADEAAAKAYKNKAMNDLNRNVGEDNSYYGQIKGWINEIVDQIDDVFQNDAWLHLNSSDGKSSDYKVDPEIDV